MRCDAHTFAQMYETVYIDLYRFALCMMKNKHDAEDAVGEAVLKAYENAVTEKYRFFSFGDCMFIY